MLYNSSASYIARCSRTFRRRRNQSFRLRSLEISSKKSWPRTRQMRSRSSVSMLSLRKILYVWVRVQQICRANHVTVRPVSLRFCLMQLPICIIFALKFAASRPESGRLLISLKKAWTLFSLSGLRHLQTPLHNKQSCPRLAGISARKTRKDIASTRFAVAVPCAKIWRISIQG